MASVADLCNIALSHIGARAQVASISPPDGSAEAGHCARFYPIVRKELLDYRTWSFSKTRAALAEVTNPSTTWAYAYALPADCIRAMRILSAVETTGTVPSERDSSPFDIESGVLLTNEPEAVLVYRRDVVDTTKYTPLFQSALGMLLAGYLSGVIIKGTEGARIGADWRQRGFQTADAASAADANGSSEAPEPTPTYITARL